jgi:hypothetical protein
MFVLLLGCKLLGIAVVSVAIAFSGNKKSGYLKRQPLNLSKFSDLKDTSWLTNKSS